MVSKAPRPRAYVPLCVFALRADTTSCPTAPVAPAMAMHVCRIFDGAGGAASTLVDFARPHVHYVLRVMAKSNE